MYVEHPSQLSYLSGGKDIGPLFGLQRPGQLFVYLEDTSATSTLMLRLPTAMSGRFYDGTTGSVVGEVTVESTRKLPRQADSSKGDWPAAECLGRNVSGGTRPRLSWGRSPL